MALQSTDEFKSRAADWRNGAIVYQVFVDRFAPSKSLDSKRRFYAAPRSLKNWDETPVPGHPIESLGLWSHELEFWGGDLESLSGKLDYVQSVGADVLYLTPIAQAFTNHKYDTQDYTKISPELGTRSDVVALAHDVHARKMKLMLDGVFNHMGRTSALFQEALKNPKSLHRDWFSFGSKYPNGYLGWAGVSNMPRLRLETPTLREYLWGGSNSVVKQYLHDGIDGWRLDVAFEIGPTFLNELTKSAHLSKPGSAVVGEISGYPSNWFPAVDGVFNFFLLDVIERSLNGEISGGRVGRIFQHSVEDAGIEHLLKSWLLADNHDTARLASVVPDLAKRKMVLGLQFTLPGSPVIYYGTELGMQGAGDPQNRAPMRWDLVRSSNPVLSWTKKLIQIRKKFPALKYGNFTALDTETLIAFARTTSRLQDSVIVVANPTDGVVHEVLPTRIGRLLSWGELKDAITGMRVRSVTGNLSIELKPFQTVILTPVIGPPYERVP